MFGTNQLTLNRYFNNFFIKILKVAGCAKYRVQIKTYLWHRQIEINGTDDKGNQTKLFKSKVIAHLAWVKHEGFKKKSVSITFVKEHYSIIKQLFWNVKRDV